MSFFANHMLVALPALQDPHFSRTVALLCQHDVDGAMGVVINRPSEFSFGDLLDQMNIPLRAEHLRGQRVLAGGPVHPERGFVLHDGAGGWDSSLSIADGLHVTTSRDVLEAMAAGEGPERATVALGCAGWGKGQLERELTQHSWLTVPADTRLIFETPLDARWQAAAGRIGVDLMHIASHSGRA
ncbi:MAG: YqgE/AlgH family protein [Luteimonas sp.]